MVNRYKRLNIVPKIKTKTIYATDNHASHFIFTGSTNQKRIWDSGVIVAAARRSVGPSTALHTIRFWNTNEKAIVNNTATSTYSVVRNSPHSSSIPLMMKYMK